MDEKKVRILLELQSQLSGGKKAIKVLDEVTKAGEELSKEGEQMTYSLNGQNLALEQGSKKLAKLQSKIEKVPKQTIKASKATKTYSQNLEELMTNAGASFRTFLPIMFGFQQVSQSLRSAVQPAMDLLGVNELYQQFLAVKYLPTAMEQLDNVLLLGEAWMDQDETTRKAEGDTILFTQRMSELLSYVSQNAMMFGALGEVIPFVGRAMGTATGLAFGLGSALGTLSSATGQVMTDIGGLGQAAGISASENIASFMVKLGLFKDESLIPVTNSTEDLVDEINKIKDKAVKISANTTDALKNTDELNTKIQAMPDKIINISIVPSIDWGALGGKLGKAIRSWYEHVSEFPAFNPKGMESFQEGGIMPYTGLAYLHKGETIIPSGSNSGITINANYYTNISDRSEIEKMFKENNKYLVEEVKRQINM